MGMRARVSRENRRRQKERERAMRRAQMMLARPQCLDCLALLTREEPAAEIWRCEVCGGTFLRHGPRWLVRVEEIPQDAAAKAA